MAEREPFLARREIAYRLREATQIAGMIGRKLAHELGRDEPTISHWLRGSRVIREADVAAMLTACQVPRTEWDELLCLVRAQPGLSSILLRGDRQYSGYRDHLAGATTVVEVAATQVPRLAQTAGYAHAWDQQPGCVMAAGQLGLLPRATPAHASTTRRWRGPPQVTLVVHEAALHAAVGEPAVMVRQRAHLQALADLPYVQLRVVPGLAHTTACTTDSFTLTRYHEHRPAVLRHEPGGLVGCDDPDYVADHQENVERLLELAWDTERSAGFLHDLASTNGTGVLVPAGGEA
jgi:transcriptional regulator with XRE-family HTH domain